MTTEPMTEAEYVNVVQREAFQRFGHAGAARVIVALRACAEAQTIDVIDNGNPYVFCDHVEQFNYSSCRGCTRGAGHNGPHLLAGEGWITTGNSPVLLKALAHPRAEAPTSENAELQPVVDALKEKMKRGYGLETEAEMWDELANRCERAEAALEMALSFPEIRGFIERFTFATPESYAQRTPRERELYQLWVTLKIKIEQSRACAEAPAPIPDRLPPMDLRLVKTLVDTMKRIPAPPSWVGYMEQLIAEIEWLRAWVPPPSVEYRCAKHGHRVPSTHPRLDATLTCPEFVTYDEPRLNVTPRWQVCGSQLTLRAEAPATDKVAVESERLIEHMVNRFLAWRLPEDFNPDGGISFARDFNEHTAYPMKHEPTGTNLFTATQAEVMVRHLLGGDPEGTTTTKTRPIPLPDPLAEAPATDTGENMTEPRNCPFCGGKAYATRTVNGTQMFNVGCASCGIAMKAAWYRDEEKPTKDILSLWNQRAEALAPSPDATLEVQETQEDTRGGTHADSQPLRSSAATAGAITTPAPKYPLCKCGHPVRDHIAARTCWPSEHFECGCQMYEPTDALAPPEPCVWTLEDEDGSAYQTSCGEMFEFNDGGPAENKAKFCQYCGKALVVSAPPRADALEGPRTDKVNEDENALSRGDTQAERDPP